MSDATTAAAPTPLATRRVNRGRGHGYLLDGVDADGVTWVLSEGVPKPALIGWAANTIRDYAVDHWDELAAVAPSERVKQLTRARYESRDAAANRGTAVHALAHQLAAGQEIDVPEELVGHVDAYLQFAKDWQPQEQLVEVVCVNRMHRYMGTLDLVAHLADGDTWLLDWKTGGTGVYPEVALQLAAYRNAETYLGPDAQEHPMPEVDRCGVVWIRADGYDLFPVQADVDTFRTFLYAQQIAHWRKQQEEQPVIGEALAR
jgi:hypothetical protein